MLTRCKNQYLQCVVPALKHAEISQQRNDAELNNDGMLKLGDVHCQTDFIIFTARCYAERGYEIACRLSVCLSITFRYRDHIGWNSSKINSPPNSLRQLLTSTATSAIWYKWNRNAVMSTKHLQYLPKRCKIGQRLLWRTNRKSHRRFRLVPKSITLNSRNVTLAQINKITEPTRKIWTKRFILSAAKCRSICLQTSFAIKINITNKHIVHT